MIAPNLRLRPGEHSLPLDPEQEFGRRAPLVVEIGFGNATFLHQLAIDHPEYNLIGVEIAAASMSRGIAMARRAGLSHLRLFGADARVLLREMLPPESVHRVVINFPDPWPKDRHQERRLMQVPFFRVLSTRLEDRGTVLFTSDHEEYFDFCVAQARSTGLFDVEIKEPPAEMLLTKYARKWQAEKKPIQHVVFTLRERDSDPHPPLLEFVDMAHARLKGSLPDIEGFETLVHDIDGGHVVLREAMRSADRERLVFQVLVDEGDLRQDCLIEARVSKTGDVYVELLGFAAPASTRGMRAAVDCVADWLAARGLEKVQSAT